MQTFSSRDSVNVAQLPGVEQAILSAILGAGSAWPQRQAAVSAADGCEACWPHSRLSSTYIFTLQKEDNDVSRHNIEKVARMNTEQKGSLLPLGCCSQDNKSSKQGV